MKNFCTLIVLLFSALSIAQNNKIPVYAWIGGPGEASNKELKKQFKDFKK